MTSIHVIFPFLRSYVFYAIFHKTSASWVWLLTKSASTATACAVLFSRHLVACSCFFVWLSLMRGCCCCGGVINSVAVWGSGQARQLGSSCFVHHLFLTYSLHALFGCWKGVYIFELAACWKGVSRGGVQQSPVQLEGLPHGHVTGDYLKSAFPKA